MCFEFFIAAAAFGCAPGFARESKGAIGLALGKLMRKVLQSLFCRPSNILLASVGEDELRHHGAEEDEHEGDTQSGFGKTFIENTKVNDDRFCFGEQRQKDHGSKKTLPQRSAEQIRFYQCAGKAAVRALRKNCKSQPN